MDATAHYRHLLHLGREQFLASAAPAALVRYRSSNDDLEASGEAPLTLDQGENTLERPGLAPADSSGGIGPDLEVYPLAKKPGASFPDRITIGRTPNNDIVIVDHSISRLHAYLRQDGKGWVVADAGSKNGSWLTSASLEPRKERTLASRSVLRVGDVDLTFYLAPDLFAALGGA